MAALALSVLDADSLDPKPKEDQNALMLDMTLRTLDTEWIDSRSPLGRCGLFKNDTYAAEASVLIFSRRMFIGPTGTESSSKRDKR